MEPAKTTAEELPKPYPALACADCLEAAGGRQEVHNNFKVVDRCPCCRAHTALCAPEHFGKPALQGFLQP